MKNKLDMTFLINEKLQQRHLAWRGKGKALTDSCLRLSVIEVEGVIVVEVRLDGVQIELDENENLQCN